MQELISLHFGQAGVQLGAAWWELFCLEHGISPDETCLGDEKQAETYLEVTKEGKWSPRAIFIDTETNTLDALKAGDQGQFLNKDYMIAGKEDCSNLYTVGHYTRGKQILPAIMETARKAVEKCDNFQGFMVTNSFGGGTGSGLTALVMERLNVELELGKKASMSFSIYPSPQIPSFAIEPYNAVLFMESAVEEFDTCFLVDNESLYDLYSKHMPQYQPDFRSMNRLVAQVISSITAPIRFNGTSLTSLKQLQENLSPHPRLHFPIISYAPIISISSITTDEMDLSNLTQSCFDGQSQLLKCDSSGGKCMAACMLYRGDVAVKDINRELEAVKEDKQIQFGDGSGKGFSVGITFEPPTTVPEGDMAKVQRSACHVNNSTAIKRVFEDLAMKSDSLYAKRAWYHWYVGDGLEDSFYSYSKNKFEAFIEEYEPIHESKYRKE